MQTKKETKCK